jgi:hypothetical protein
MKYRESRNIEASVIDYLTEELVEDGWSGVSLYKVFAQVYKQSLPAILVNVNTTDTVKLEIGSRTHLNYYNIYLRIFGENDGNRLDLTDWLLHELERDIPYNEYTVEGGQVVSKQQNGMITILKISRNEREFINTEILDKEDRYRQLLVVQCYIAKC